MTRCETCDALVVLATCTNCTLTAAFQRDDWSDGNRAACDFFHRRVVVPAKPMTEWEREAFFTPAPTPWYTPDAV